MYHLKIFCRAMKALSTPYKLRSISNGELIKNTWITVYIFFIAIEHVEQYRREVFLKFMTVIVMPHRTITYSRVCARVREMKHLKIWFNYLMPFSISYQLTNEALWTVVTWMIYKCLTPALSQRLWHVSDLYRITFTNCLFHLFCYFSNWGIIQSVRFCHEGTFFMRAIKYDATTLRYL